MMPMHFQKYPGLENLFILGDAFMSEWYTIFDRDQDKVGFAKSKKWGHDEAIIREPNQTAYIIDAINGRPEYHYGLP